MITHQIEKYKSPYNSYPYQQQQSAIPMTSVVVRDKFKLNEFIQKSGLKKGDWIVHFRCDPPYTPFQIYKVHEILESVVQVDRWDNYSGPACIVALGHRQLHLAKLGILSFKKIHEEFVPKDWQTDWKDPNDNAPDPALYSG